MIKNEDYQKKIHWGHYTMLYIMLFIYLA
jgi:hypothetical protein